jgi:hypothetical protein
MPNIPVTTGPNAVSTIAWAATAVPRRAAMGRVRVVPVGQVVRKAAVLVLVAPVGRVVTTADLGPVVKADHGVIFDGMIAAAGVVMNALRSRCLCRKFQSH